MRTSPESPFFNPVKISTSSVCPFPSTPGPDGCLLGQWERPRVQDVSTHGTGCSLSAAVAARLAAGDGLVAAVERGLEFIASSIRNHLRWEQPVRVDALKLW